MKIRENKEEVVLFSFNAMVVGEVYKDGTGTYYMRTQSGAVNLSLGNYIHASEVDGNAIFTHCPDAEMVV